MAREALRLSAPRLGTGMGWPLASTARYDRTRPVVVLDPILEIGPDSAPASLEYRVADPREPLRILGQLARGRFGVRLLSRRRERAREVLAPTPTVILDDSVFALYFPADWSEQPQEALARVRPGRRVPSARRVAAPPPHHPFARRRDRAGARAQPRLPSVPERPPPGRVGRAERRREPPHPDGHRVGRLGVCRSRSAELPDLELLAERRDVVDELRPPGAMDPER